MTIEVQFKVVFCSNQYIRHSSKIFEAGVGGVCTLYFCFLTLPFGGYYLNSTTFATIPDYSKFYVDGYLGHEFKLINCYKSIAYYLLLLSYMN